MPPSIDWYATASYFIPIIFSGLLASLATVFLSERFLRGREKQKVKEINASIRTMLSIEIDQNISQFRTLWQKLNAELWENIDTGNKLRGYKGTLTRLPSIVIRRVAWESQQHAIPSAFHDQHIVKQIAILYATFDKMESILAMIPLSESIMHEQYWIDFEEGMNMLKNPIPQEANR